MPSHYLNQCWNHLQILQTSLKFQSVCIHFHWRRSILKWHLENGIHFVSASMCYQVGCFGSLMYDNWGVIVFGVYKHFCNYHDSGSALGKWPPAWCGFFVEHIAISFCYIKCTMNSICFELWELSENIQVQFILCSILCCIKIVNAENDYCVYDVQCLCKV